MIFNNEYKVINDPTSGRFKNFISNHDLFQTNTIKNNNFQNSDLNNIKFNNASQKSFYGNYCNSFSTNCEKDNFLNTQILNKNIYDTNYSQIPLNFLTSQYPTQNSNFHNKNYLSNLSSVSQNPFTNENLNRNFNDKELNEVIKIQEKLRKFSQLFRDTLENKMDKGFSLIKEKNDISVKSNNTICNDVKKENNIYFDLKNKLIEVEFNTKNIRKKQKENYSNFCYLILRIKEKSIQAKKHSTLLGRKIDIYTSFSDKLVDILEKIKNILKFDFEKPDDNLNSNIKPEFKVFFEILENLKSFEKMKNNFLKSDNKITEKFNALNIEIDQRIKFIEENINSIEETKEKKKIKEEIINSKKTYFASDNEENNSIKSEEEKKINKIYDNIESILNEVSVKFKELIEQKDNEKYNKNINEDFNLDVNAKANAIVNKNDFEKEFKLNNIKNEEIKSNLINKSNKNEIKNLKFLEKIKKRKPNMIRNEISQFFKLRTKFDYNNFNNYYKNQIFPSSNEENYDLVYNINKIKKNKKLEKEIFNF